MQQVKGVKWIRKSDAEVKVWEHSFMHKCLPFIWSGDLQGVNYNLLKRREYQTTWPAS